MIQRWDWLGDYERERIVSLTDGDYVLYTDHEAALDAATVRDVERFRKQEDRITGLEAHNVTLIAEGLRQNDLIAQLEATVQRLSAPVGDEETEEIWFLQRMLYKPEIYDLLEAFITNRLREPTNA